MTDSTGSPAATHRLQGRPRDRVLTLMVAGELVVQIGPSRAQPPRLQLVAGLISAIPGNEARDPT